MVDLNITFPEGFLDEEVRCGYTVTHEMKELWAVELDLLNEFQRVCKENNLKYYACGGTLLGAVRHKGFIPWDDDIDVAMFREDYEKLKQLGNSVFRDGYFLQSTYTDDLVRTHMQLRKDGTTCLIKNDFGKKHHRGIFIDIFVYDNVPDDDKELQRFKNKLATYYSWINVLPVLSKQDSFTLKYAIKRVKRIVKRIMCKAFVATQGGRVKAFQKFESMAQLYDTKVTSRVANISFLCVAQKMNLYETVSFEQEVMLPFENLIVVCPQGFAKNLTEQYGNYMKYAVGNSMHGEIFFDVSNSYEIYNGCSETNFKGLFQR